MFWRRKRKEAAAAKARIDDGAAFADVARDVSTGPTGPNGGNLGWFGVGAMVPAFEEAVMALEVGGVTEPFETQFGWHVATLLDTRVQPRPTIDDLRPEPGQFDPSLVDATDLLD